jgi:hypothetical protein
MVVHRLAAAAVLAATAMVLAAGCTSSQPAASPSTALRSGAISAGQNLTGLVRELGSCIHAHGAPDFPEPSIDAGGHVVFPSSAPDLPATVQAACQSIIDQLPAPAASSAVPVSPRTLQQWLAFAACMRRHGLPQWPDPQPDGSFDLPASIRALPSDAVAPAFQACRALSPNPDGKYTISGSGS